jgi:hypothetical protein
MVTLGRGYVAMAVPAFLVIAIDQSLGFGHAASGRLALAASIGAALGLGINKLITMSRG